MKKIMIVFAAVLLLTGCADPPKSGYITERKFHPAYYYITFQCAGYDGKGNCTMNIPVQHYVPDSYELCMKDDTTKKDGCRSSTVDEYEQYQIGMHYPNPM